MKNFKPKTNLHKPISLNIFFFYENTQFVILFHHIMNAGICGISLKLVDISRNI